MPSTVGFESASSSSKAAEVEGEYAWVAAKKENELPISSTIVLLAQLVVGYPQRTMAIPNPVSPLPIPA